ncbi:uncharacterized protein LOC124157471 [Ischnura elegans]|uniref:uncharacterized protein LOC124157471 n=1 Tax=Ischnura elegans TaxID=197161 RepID=UPI001ED87FFB|nr:uncharacterized protein LOC124157471 [Ischnura elegans]
MTSQSTTRARGRKSSRVHISRPTHGPISPAHRMPPTKEVGAAARAPTGVVPGKPAEVYGTPRRGRRRVPAPLFLITILLPLLLLSGNAFGQQQPQRQDKQPTTVKKQARPRAKTVADLFNTSSCALPPYRCPYPRIEFYLYTRSTQEEGEKLDLLKDAGPALMETHFDAAHPTKVVIHGFGGGRKYSPSPDMRKAYFTRGEYNVIIVDYSSLVVEPCLSQIEWAPRFCALCIAQLIGWLDDAWRWSIRGLLSVNRVTRQADTRSRYRDFNDYDDDDGEGPGEATADGDFGQRVVQLLGRTAGRTRGQGGAEAVGGGLRGGGESWVPNNAGVGADLPGATRGNEVQGATRGNGPSTTRGSNQGVTRGNSASAVNQAPDDTRGNVLGTTRGGGVTRIKLISVPRGTDAVDTEGGKFIGVTKTDAPGTARGNTRGAGRVNVQGVSRVNVQGANRAKLQGVSRENGRGKPSNAGRVYVQGLSRVNVQGVGRGAAQGFARGNSQGGARNVLSATRINALIGGGGSVGNGDKITQEVVQETPRRLRFVGSPPQGVHVIGYSVGAHIAGLIANYVGEKRIGRITGLDPTIIFYMGSNRSRDLDPTDALFVDVIHTGAGVLGQWGPNGHVDFYVNGGTSQPGCTGGIYETLACDHQKVTPYFIESITSERGFWATPCSNLLLYLVGWCTTTDRSKLIKMGEDVPPSARGIYYLETNARKPYAKGLPPDVTRRRRRGRG